MFLFTKLLFVYLFGVGVLISIGFGNILCMAVS